MGRRWYKPLSKVVRLVSSVAGGGIGRVDERDFFLSRSVCRISVSHVQPTLKRLIIVRHSCMHGRGICIGQARRRDPGCRNTVNLTGHRIFPGVEDFRKLAVPRRYAEMRTTLISSRYTIPNTASPPFRDTYFLSYTCDRLS